MKKNNTEPLKINQLRKRRALTLNFTPRNLALLAIGLFLLGAGMFAWFLKPIPVFSEVDGRTSSVVTTPSPSADSSEGNATDDASAIESEYAVYFPAYALDLYTGDLEELKKRKVIRALVTPSLTDFFLADKRIMGLQAEILEHFEEFINKDVRNPAKKINVVYIPVPFEQMIPALVEGRGDIAAALLTVTSEREERVDFISGRSTAVDELLVTHVSVPEISSVDDLSGESVYVLRGSSYVGHLQEMNEEFVEKGLEPMHIVEADPNLHTEDILELVNAGVIRMTVVDHYLAELWSRVLREMRVYNEIKINKGGYVGWAIRKDSPELTRILKEFSSTIKRGTLLGNILIQRYFGTTRWIGNPNVQKQRKNVEHIMLLFQKYGAQYGFDWLALAAQAYQESGWEHDSKSHRGAVGIMQLLPSTAADPKVNISDISNLENNIHAGTKYMAFLLDRYYSDEEMFATEDQLAFSWAAYNAGPAKVRRIRALTEEMGLDPNRWFHNAEYAAQKITGRETVHYVANVYKYYVAMRLGIDVSSHRR